MIDPLLPSTSYPAVTGKKESKVHEKSDLDTLQLHKPEVDDLAKPSEATKILPDPEDSLMLDSKTDGKKISKQEDIHKANPAKKSTSQ